MLSSRESAWRVNLRLLYGECFKEFQVKDGDFIDPSSNQIRLKDLNYIERRNKMTKLTRRTLKIGITGFLLAVLLLVPLGSVFAAGQPNQSCQIAGVTPGQSISAPGSAFNPSGTAGTVYAGQQPQNSGNPKAVSQYDVACYQVSIH